ncbi:hypothetical protein D8833_05270 [Streptococcus intermedius]|nr:hypothetical protein D8833_05270 [Streptococcus intermedius]RSJ15882.1 hypothetical protein D8831_06640 [Streptococcus intermedius]RSJ19729.1 hypothetical protein D8829_06945 [Streptococcus intermedius]
MTIAILQTIFGQTGRSMVLFFRDVRSCNRQEYVRDG